MTIRRVATASVVACSLFATAACATIIKGTSQDVTVSSSPSGAALTIKSSAGIDVYQGATPAVVKLAKKKEYTVTLSQKGYEDVKLPITQSFQGWFIGNLLCGGIIGMIVDAVDGAMWDLEPETISVTLKAVGGAPAATASNEATEPVSCGDGGSVVSSQVHDIKRGDDGSTQLYAVFHARDAEGQLRSLAVPMVRKANAAL